MNSDEFVSLVAQVNLNLYGAVGNDPLNLYDSFGLSPCSGSPGGGGGGAGGAGTGTGEQLGLPGPGQWVGGIVGTTIGALGGTVAGR